MNYEQILDRIYNAASLGLMAAPENVLDFKARCALEEIARLCMKTPTCLPDGKLVRGKWEGMK